MRGFLQDDEHFIIIIPYTQSQVPVFGNIANICTGVTHSVCKPEEQLAIDSRHEREERQGKHLSVVMVRDVAY